jgi:hypothetical protein
LTTWLNGRLTSVKTRFAAEKRSSDMEDCIILLREYVYCNMPKFAWDDEQHTRSSDYDQFQIKLCMNSHETVLHLFPGVT